MRQQSTIFLDNFISSLRTSNIYKFNTNFFIRPKSDPVFINYNRNSIVFLLKELNFYKLYFAYTDLASLEDLLSNLPKLTIYLEIVSNSLRENDLDRVVTKYFNYFKTYQVLYKKLNLKETNTKPVEVSEKDVAQIYTLFTNLFDYRFEHLMSYEQIKDLANRNCVIALKNKKEIKSFMIYSNQGSRAKMHQLANFGGKESLIELWARIYNDMAIKKINYVDLWYDMTNEKAKKMYKIENFIHLNKYNHCYILK